MATLTGRSRDCIKAHQSAIEVTKAIAAALRKASEAAAEHRLGSGANASSPPTTPGQRTGTPSHPQGDEQRSESTPRSTKTPAGAREEDTAAATPAAGDTGASPAGDSDGNTPVVAVVGQKKDRDDGDESAGGRGGARPVLTLMQHLCVSAPERAEGRVRVAEGLAALLPEVEDSDRSRFVSFLAKVHSVPCLVSVWRQLGQGSLHYVLLPSFAQQPPPFRFC